LTQAFNIAKKWFHRNGFILFPLLAFAIPLIVRTIPEILMGTYLVGFDSVAYYIPNTLTWLNNGVSFWTLTSSAPLIYLLLMGVTYIGIPITVTLKVFGPLLLGLLSLSIYYYAQKALSWSQRKSLVVAFLSTLFFVSLRISWDMFRSELALIILFFALVILAKKQFSLKSGMLLSVTTLLIALTHQLITIILFVIVAAALIEFYLNKQKIEMIKLLVCLIPAMILFLTILYIDYSVFSSPVVGTTITTSSGLTSLVPTSTFGALIDDLGFFIYCFLPLIPLLFQSAKYFKAPIPLKAWVIWTGIPVVLAIVVPGAFLGGVYPYRWIMLLAYPLAFYAVEGLSLIRLKRSRIAVGIIVALIVCVLSAGFISAQNSTAFDYFGAYTSYIPKSMLQNTVPASECQSTANAFVWAQTHLPVNGRLLVHEAFYGWGFLYLNGSQLLPYGFLNPQDIAGSERNARNFSPIYLIWWVNGTGWYGQPNVSSAFQPLYQSGNMAIYNYTGD
jgi:hypothetical protein